MNSKPKSIGLADSLSINMKYMKVALTRIVEHTNLAYVEPHKVIINNRLYLFFNEQKYFYIGNLQNKIPLAELSEYIARH